LKQGWEEFKPKGLLQVLWESGFTDKSTLESYTLNSRQDEWVGFTLKLLIGSCLDFEEEETLLHSTGVLVDRTLKCHCELAKAGIKYCRLCAENFYHPVVALRVKGGNRSSVLWYNWHVKGQSVNTQQEG
jgi:hypothetical protein